MCDAALDGVPLRRGLSSISWRWMGVMAIVAALVVIGYRYWRDQPQPVAVVATATPKPTNTPTPLPPTVTPTFTPSATPSPVPSPTRIIHEVQSGETVIYIASYYGTSTEAILEANGLDENSARLLYPGQQLLIPSTGPVGGPVPNSTAPPPQVIHEVESGETLISIAYDYDTTIETIMGANNLDSPDLIYEGQQLIVPLLPPTLTPTLTPTPTPSSTPGPPYLAPALLSPPDNALFEGEDAVVLLAWASVGILRDNQAYLVVVEMPATGTPVTHTTQGTSWRLPSDLWPIRPDPSFSWWVTVVQRDNPDSDESPVWKPLSLPSETRHFVWR
jgi:LysM repeat protein